MSKTDPLGEMLTRIRNGQQAKKDSVLSPASRLRARVLEVLQREGYIRGYSEDAKGTHPKLRIELKYFEGEPAIKHIARVSKPGRRVYSGSKEFPVVSDSLLAGAGSIGFDQTMSSKRNAGRLVEVLSDRMARAADAAALAEDAQWASEALIGVHANDE